MKKILILFIAILLLPIKINALQNYKDITSSITGENIEEDKINLYLFYSESCPHCHNEIEYLIKAYDLGTDGYIVKDSDSKELKRAIINLIDGKTYIQPNLLPLLNNRLLIKNLEKDKLDTLTKREKEMLVYIAKGMFNKEIAMELKISERTVKNHISNLFRKIDVNDRTQAAVFAIKNDLVKLY